MQLWIRVTMAAATIGGSSGCEVGSEPDSAETGVPTGSENSGAGNSQSTGSMSSSPGFESSTSQADGGVEPIPGASLYEEDFAGPDGSAWPSPWTEVGDQIISAQLNNGRARFNGQTGNVGRMILPGFSESDVDVSFTLTYENFYAQGVGFYVRQNGGALQQTATFGQGYAVYIEGGFQQYIGLWKETDGVEEIIEGVTVPGGFLDDAVDYGVRFQCFTEGEQTRLRARIWRLGEEDEPNTWIIDRLDSTAPLQGITGSFAADIYNYAGTASAYIDDIRVHTLSPE